jgi:hypothetical protein
MSEERLFLILEVVKDYEIYHNDARTIRVFPCGSHPLDEPIVVKPERIIPESQLGYKAPNCGMTCFEPAYGGWVEFLDSPFTRLVREPEPKSPFDKLIDECPLDNWQPETRRKLAEWIRKIAECEE